MGHDILQRRPQPLVEVVGPTDGWVLEGLAKKLVAKLPYATFAAWRPSQAAHVRLVYYVNYALFDGPSGAIDVGFFTHLEEDFGFTARARRMDHCVAMSAGYADWLLRQGVADVTHVAMGCDFYRYQPGLVLGVIGRLDHPRKGRRLVDQLRQLPFVEVVATEGRVSEADLRDVYQRIDCVLIPATVEGGPMSLLEGLAMGKPIIAPGGVGMVDEFNGSPAIYRYRVGEFASLRGVVTALYEEKLARRRLVADRTWDDWAEAHHRLFQRLLAEGGTRLSDGAPGFRFGLMRGLDAAGDLEALERGLDCVAAELYFGQYGGARLELERLRPAFPCVQRLLAELPAAREVA